MVRKTLRILIYFVLFICNHIFHLIEIDKLKSHRNLQEIISLQQQSWCPNVDSLEACQQNVLLAKHHPSSRKGGCYNLFHSAIGLVGHRWGRR